VADEPERESDLDDDALLATRAAEGDEGAFEVLVRRHGPVLLRLAGQLGDGPDGGDPGAAGDPGSEVREAFVSAWRRLPEFRGETAFRGWMYRIVTHHCLNQSRSRRPTAPGRAASPGTAEAPAAVRAVRRALGALSPEQRACWVLREFHGLSDEDIAYTVGISHRAVRGRIFRARRCLTEARETWR
jgi:RNA polymerase sigma-70 factor (ECF subfamily)